MRLIVLKNVFSIIFKNIAHGLKRTIKYVPTPIDYLFTYYIIFHGVMTIVDVL